MTMINNEVLWTGERLETTVFNNTAVAHLHRYAFAIDFVKNKIVLDIASGEGYGSNLLSKYSKQIYGVDIDVKALLQSREKYKAKNLEFRVGSADSIPLSDNSVDVVISFETLEHHDKHQKMMEEIKRVLRQDGTLIMSTPNKKNYSDNSGYKNPFHVKELYISEFTKLINGYFSHTQFYFQNIFSGSLMVPEHNSNNFISYHGDFDSITGNPEFISMYVVAVASDYALVAGKCSGFHGNKIEEIEKKELENRIRTDTKNEVVNSIEKSWNFRVGKMILGPLKPVLKLIREILRKK